MRVLMLTWELTPRRRGPAAHVDGLAHALANNGHEVVVLTTSGGGPADQEWIADGGAFVRVLRADISLPWIPDEFHVANAASACHHLVQLAGALGDWRPEVVHAHNWEVAWAADTLARLFAVPLVTTFHTTTQLHHGGRVPPGEPASIHAAESWLAHRSDQVITTSQFLVNEVCAGFELPADRVHRVPNGIDPTWWETDDEVTERAPLVLAWGRVRYEKGFQVLARALNEVRSAIPEIECVIAGRGSYLPELQSQVDIEGVSDIVRLVGFIRDERLRDYVHRAGCVAIPSLYEPFGIVALEALAGGAPLIAARTGGLAELIEGTGGGMLFEPGNPADLAACIIRALTDQEATEAMRRRGRALLRARYSWRAIAGATARVYAGATPADTDKTLTPV